MKWSPRTIVWAITIPIVVYLMVNAFNQPN